MIDNYAGDYTSHYRQDYTKTFSGAADIDMMRDVFNDMLTRIELNEQALEQRVADRTSELKPEPLNAVGLGYFLSL